MPSHLKDKGLLEFHWDANNEALVWSEDGEPLQGLTGGGERREWIFPKNFRDGKFHTFYIEMACNRMFGNGNGGDVIQPPNPDVYFQLYLADIVAINQEARALYIDFWIIGGWNPKVSLPTAAKKTLQTPQESFLETLGNHMRLFKSVMPSWMLSLQAMEAKNPF